MFLQQYPQFVGRNTWIAGESYAGVYIPTLTQQIFMRPNSQLYKQLKGIMLGNPVISCVTADYLAIQFNLFYWHGLVSHTQYANWTAYGCAQSSSNPGCGYIFNVSMDQIGLIVQQVYLGEQPSLDPDDLYQDFCTGNGTLDFTTNVGYPAACSPIGMLTTAYLNRRDVQAALHVMPTQWTECGMVNYSMSGSSMIPLYQGFFKQNPLLNVLISLAMWTSSPYLLDTPVLALLNCDRW